MKHLPTVSRETSPPLFHVKHSSQRSLPNLPELPRKLPRRRLNLRDRYQRPRLPVGQRVQRQRLADRLPSAQTPDSRACLVQFFQPRCALQEQQRPTDAAQRQAQLIQQAQARNRPAGHKIKLFPPRRVPAKLLRPRGHGADIRKIQQLRGFLYIFYLFPGAVDCRDMQVGAQDCQREGREAAPQPTSATVAPAGMRSAISAQSA